MILSDVSIRRPVFTVIVMAVLVLFGAISYTGLGLDMMPKVEAPYITISVIYPGADPEVVEDRVLEPIEEAVSTISGLKKIVSKAAESYGLVFCEFELDVSADRAVQDVRDQMAKIERDLPADVEKPTIQKIDIGAVPVLSAVLTGPAGASAAELTYVADKKAKNAIQRLPGVGLVDVIGKQEREIHILADPQKLRNFGLTLPDLEMALRYGNLDVPGGRLTIGRQELLLKTHGEATSLDELRDLVVANPLGAPIRLKDVAELRDTTEEQRTIAALDGKRSLTLQVRKQSDANSVAVADAVKQAIAEDRIDLPEGYRLQVVQSSSEFTRRSVSAVLDDLLLGALLAVLVILFFLRDWRATFISALALPTSVIATFALMKMLHFTLNNITLMSLSLSIGMLIDDAIVVIENIHRHLTTGEEPRQAAGRATAEIGLAVLATTLTIAAVFVPVAFMKGIVGRIFYEFGLTVAFAVMVSLFVSFTLTPMGASRLLKEHAPGRLSRAIGRGLNALDRLYRRIIGWVLNHRLATIGTGVAALAAAIFMVRYIPQEFIPSFDQGELDVIYSMPEGTSLEATFQRGEDIRRTLQQDFPVIRSMLVTVGTGAMQLVNEGKVFVQMPGSKERRESIEQIAAEMRTRLARAFPGEDISVSPSSFMGGGSGDDIMRKPLNVQLRGADIRELASAARALAARLREVPGIVDLTISEKGTRPQLGFRLDRDKVSAAGLSPAQVALAVRTAIQGSEVGQFRAGTQRYKVLLKAPEAVRQSRQAVLAMPLRGAAANPLSPPGLVELGELVRPVDEGAAAQINREDRARQVTIAANLEGMALGTAQQRVQEIAPTVLPANVSLRFSGQGQMMAESFSSISQTLILAVVLIFMVLAAQFESFLHPFTIMLPSLLMSFIGAFGALLVTRQTLSMISAIGLILLMGLVTKNAILLVDNANQRRWKGAPVREALIEAGAVRLRPILMTTLAMIFGMLPVALGLSEGSEFRSSMGVAVIGGLITSTLLTLLVVPALYSSFESARAALKRAFGGKGPTGPASA
ncbi:MAG: efflux RND transporter permease subunit [Myxococcales bacterium]|nr:efflux RND transporter permease subunit [Myxococcales bacterium]